ncbi:transcription termination factor MTERF6, chloroplastic/mitochondrial-like [Malania oleifera]|uniref:transcription termination factor MTERF6, chloroplastic/mitochondrial-like n=1 Tax=Malania oleifera TaxID=397392 RepID=UPI0025AE2D84|nr:transcription termination factor MTERF6, chloroplastic/mitochondrial-like [Malania oleifera]XP_057963729.1 transcription termination factor MTERF6, chloroplastic/mitochondrial-like [Malania oleifera]
MFSAVPLRSPFTAIVPEKLYLAAPSVLFHSNNPPFLSLRCCVSSKCLANQHSFTISYLMDSCGLSPETASSASEKVHFETPERPDSVVTLLRNYGFSETHISNLVRRRPSLLLANPEQTLLPKLEFFVSIGIPKPVLARTLSSNPTLLTRSLEKQIIPSYNFLISIVRSNYKVASAMKRTTWIFLEDYAKNLEPNIGVLREIGVRESCISLLVTHFPEALVQKNELFCEIVDEVQRMGFDPLKSTFVLAVHALSGKGNKLIRDRCYETYTRWGWTEDDILLAFRKHPHCMILSEKKITRAMDYFVNKMGWPAGLFARCPVVLFLSLEKRIIPRCSVIRILLSKDLIKKEVSLSSVLLPVERLFLKRFVTKYEEEVPQLFSVYQGKTDVLEV